MAKVMGILGAIGGKVAEERAAQQIADLLFIHNTTPDKLLRQEAMGGLPNPSIAVTQQDIPFAGFGDISLIGRPEAFDPKMRGNPMYSADAYTVRAPSPVRIANKGAYKQFKDDFGAYREYGNLDDVAYSLGDLEAKTRLEPSDFRRVNDFLEYNNAAQVKFANDNDLDLPLKEDGSIDSYRLSDLKSENADKYSAWKSQQMDKYFQPDEYFVSNPDYDRYAGKANLKPYTADNVSRWMTRRSGANKESTMTFGAGNVRASTAQPIKSLDQARSIRGLLQPSDAVAEVKSTADSMLTDLQDALRDYYKYDTSSFRYFDEVGEMIAMSERMGVDRAMKEFGFENAPDSLKKEITDYADYLRSAPTEYFESKPQRAVQLSDFGGAIVPENTPQGIIDALANAGVRVESYADEAGRTAARRSFQDYMFDVAPYIGGGTALGLLAAPEDAEAGFVNRGGRTLLEAFHGSPYQFDRFDMSKIGTGEGAQAYGHGLYFADSEDLARGYRDNLAPPRQSDGNAEIMELLADPDTDAFPEEQIVDTLINRFKAGESIDDLAKNLDGDYGYWAKKLANSDPGTRSYFENTVNGIGGALYRTEIDVTPESLLDWDKPLSEQGGVVKDAAQNYFDLFRKDEGIADYLDPIFNDEYEGMTGKEFYQTLQNLYSEGYLETPIGNTLADDALMRGSIPEATSASLLDDSIRGIQYLDGSSRKAGEGTRNYVMFEDSPINIADRYAIAPPMFAPSQDRALAASNKGFLDPLTVDEQRITTHNMDVNKQMANLGLLADPMYEYGNIIPAKTNIVTGETSLAFPAIARDMVRGLLDLANTRRSGVYNPTALMDVAL